MKLYYIPPKENQKFAIVGTSKWDDVSSVLDFDELVINEDETFYSLFGHAINITNVGQIEDKQWTFKEPALIRMKIAKTNYDKRRGQETVPTEQSLIEKVLCKGLSSVEVGKPYKGTITLQHTPMLNMMVSGNGYDGKPMPDATYAMLMQGYVNLEPITELTKLTLDDVQLAAANSGGKGGFNKGGFKSQGEYDKLKDREKFIIESIVAVAPDYQGKTLGELVQHINDGGSHSMLIVALLDYVKTVIGNR